MTSKTPRSAIASLSLTMLLASLGTSIANVGLPEMAITFDATFSSVQWVVLAYLLAITAVIVSVGRLGDRIGHRRLLLAGLLLFVIACILCGAASSLAQLIAARAVQGLGAAMMMTMAMALIGQSVSKERTGRVMGLLGTMSAVGTAAGPAAGGVLIAGYGWRAVFLSLVPLGLVALALAYRALSHDKHPAPSRQTALDLRAILRNPTLKAALIMSTLVMAVMMATLVAGPFYLSHGVGLGPAWMGLAMAVGPVIAALAGMPAGRLTERFGCRAMTLAGLLAMLAGCLALALLPQQAGAAGYIGALAILTLGYAQFQTANNTLVMSDLAPDRRGVIAGLLNLSRNLGLIVGAWALGAVFAWETGDINRAPPEALSNGLHITFGLSLGLVLMAMGCQRKTALSPSAP
ncbi:MFS transporter [Pseudomonas sp. 15FMM2]|uniref:MFS transporter n=1 Tax=Pseudomonas imrae TaxID=2992837 RepID=A0ACC7PE31_9PSED